MIHGACLPSAEGRADLTTGGILTGRGGISKKRRNGISKQVPDVSFQLPFCYLTPRPVVDDTLCLSEVERLNCSLKSLGNLFAIYQCHRGRHNRSCLGFRQSDRRGIDISEELQAPEQRPCSLKTTS